MAKLQYVGYSKLEQARTRKK